MNSTTVWVNNVVHVITNKIHNATREIFHTITQVGAIITHEIYKIPPNLNLFFIFIAVLVSFQTWPFSFQRCDSSTDVPGDRDNVSWNDSSPQSIIRDKDVNYYY